MRLIALLTVVALPAFAQVTVDNPWARATAPGARVAAGYMVVKSGGADRMVGASSPAAERVEMHVTQRDGDIARMRQVKAYDIPAKGALELKPGGAHLMFVNIKAPFKEGDKVPVLLRFEKAGEVRTQFHVGRITGEPHKGH